MRVIGCGRRLPSRECCLEVAQIDFQARSVSTQVASAEEFLPMPSRCPCDRFGDP